MIKKVSVIEASDNFEGNRLEKNMRRVSEIKALKGSNNLKGIINDYVNYIKNNNIIGVQMMTKNDLYFEIVDKSIIENSCKKLKEHNNLEEDLFSTYILKGELGFINTMNTLLRKM